MTKRKNDKKSLADRLSRISGLCSNAKSRAVKKDALLLIQFFNKRTISQSLVTLHLSAMSLVIMLAGSIVLCEGFLCVLMFMLIYFFSVLVAFFAEWIKQRIKAKRGAKLYPNVIPVLVVIATFEGVIPETSFNRDYTVTREMVIDASIDEIKSHLRLNPT